MKLLTTPYKENIRNSLKPKPYKKTQKFPKLNSSGKFSELSTVLLEFTNHFNIFQKFRNLLYRFRDESLCSHKIFRKRFKPQRPQKFRNHSEVLCLADSTSFTETIISRTTEFGTT